MPASQEPEMSEEEFEKLISIILFELANAKDLDFRKDQENIWKNKRYEDFLNYPLSVLLIVRWMLIFEPIHIPKNKKIFFKNFKVFSKYINGSYQIGIERIKKSSIDYEQIIKEAIIKRCPKKNLTDDRQKSEQKWCLFDRNGDRLLGRHPTKEKAEVQERAVQFFKRR